MKYKLPEFKGQRNPICLPSTKSTQFGMFHLFQYPCAYFLQSSSINEERYSDSKTLIKTRQTSFTISLTVDSPILNAKAIIGRSSVARYLQKYYNNYNIFILII